MIPSSQDQDEVYGVQSTSRSTSKQRNDVGAYDPAFVQNMERRNIFIDSQPLPPGVSKRVEEIMKKKCSSPEMNETTAQILVNEARELKRAAEDSIVIFADHLLPRNSDERMRTVRGQRWTRFVPVPLDSTLTTGGPIVAYPPLQQPKPDVCIGYSAKAFTAPQRKIIDSLIHSETDCSYAMPHQDLHFPFLDLELKSQANGGTFVIATDQAGITGAVVGHWLVELARCASRLRSLDYNEPQLFSLNLDNKTAQFNIHRLSRRDQDGEFCFHVTDQPVHNLYILDGVKTVYRLVKNIFDWAMNVRLPMICTLLDDVYRSHQESTVEWVLIVAPEETGSESESAIIPSGHSAHTIRKRNFAVVIPPANSGEHGNERTSSEHVRTSGRRKKRKGTRARRGQGKRSRKKEAVG